MTELAASQKEAAALQADAERLELELKTTLEKNLCAPRPPARFGHAQPHFLLILGSIMMVRAGRRSIR